MAIKIKRFLTPLLLASAFIAFLSSYGILPSQSESVSVAPSKEEVKEPKKEEIITHKNCLLRCPSGTAVDNILVNHDAIVLSSNKKTKFADWVAYKVTADYIHGPERRRNWAKDPKIDVQFTFTPPDYKGMSKEPYFFDRGHQAPLASFKNHPQWHVVNYLSNITPQKKDLNRGSWKDLESAERKLVKQYEEAYVMTGPYYDKKNIVEGTPIERFTYTIPSGYWKIIAIKKGDEIKTVSFIFSQNTPLRDDYCKHRVSISEIEQATGLKFFDGKAVLQENALRKEIGCGLSEKSVTIH